MKMKAWHYWQNTTAASSLLFSLSLRFNRHFPGGSGLAGNTKLSILDFVGDKDDGGGGDNIGAVRRAKLQSSQHHQQTNTQFFKGRMPFLSPNQQCQSTEAKACVIN